MVKWRWVIRVGRVKEEDFDAFYRIVSRDADKHWMEDGAAIMTNDNFSIV